jgi:DUF1365 family protein
VPLDEAVRDLVAARIGATARGPIRLLTHLRYFGYCMNPVSFYYCYNEAGDARRRPLSPKSPIRLGGSGINTCSQCDARARSDGSGCSISSSPRDFHVSPFMPMDMQYRWCFSAPGSGCSSICRISTRADIRCHPGLRSRTAHRWALLRALAAYPLMTVKVVAAIHWQALKLWLKRTPVYGHPRPRMAETKHRETKHHSGGRRPERGRTA